MTAARKKTLAQRVKALEAEVRSLRRGYTEGFVRVLHTEIGSYLTAERERVTDEVIRGRIQKAIEEMGVDIYDRLTRHRVTVTIHTDEPRERDEAGEVVI